MWSRCCAPLLVLPSTLRSDSLSQAMYNAKLARLLVGPEMLDEVADEEEPREKGAKVGEGLSYAVRASCSCQG